MRTWMKVSLSILLVVGLCWGGAIWYWSETNRMPATQDLLLYLVVLPLGLLLAFWLGRKLIAVIAAGPAVAVPAVAAHNGAPNPATPAAPLAIMAAAIRTPHGAAVDELSAAIVDNKARADLDAELVDDAGFPVMTARSDDAGDESLQDEMTEWFVLNGIADLELSGEQWRALTLATAVTSELAGTAAGQLIPGEGLPPIMHLCPVLPAEWDISARRAAGLWLQHVVSEAGWPLARVSLAAELPADARGASPLAVLARLAYQSAISGVPMIGMIVASASHLGEASIGKWQGNATLFSAKTPQGLIPGEGAAGLLLADLLQVQKIDGAVYATLHLEADARRHNSADEAKKADAKLLGAMTEKVLVSGTAEADKVAMVVADTGHRTSRVLELMELAGAALPHLDADADVLRVGDACGTCGAVPFVTTLALGRHHAIELEAPVLCISNEDPYRRSAVLIRPPAAALS